MKNLFKLKTLLFLAIFIVIIGSIGTAFYFYQQYQTIKKNPDMISKEEVKTVTSSISRFMELPTDEEPTLATVTDAEKLKSQDFFKKALNGDRVLIYTKAQKAILYRPSTDRVIEFAPLSLGAQTQADQGNVQTEKIKVAIYNGTSTVGLTTEYEKKLASITGLVVAAKANAAKNDYTKTSVIDLTGKNQAMANQIAQLFGGNVADKLPDGETKPQADILIIAGK